MSVSFPKTISGNIREWKGEKAMKRLAIILVGLIIVSVLAGLGFLISENRALDERNDVLFDTLMSWEETAQAEKVISVIIARQTAVAEGANAKEAELIPQLHEAQRQIRVAGTPKTDYYIGLALAGTIAALLLIIVLLVVFH